jgi:hypothetical protein
MSDTDEKLREILYYNENTPDWYCDGVVSDKEAMDNLERCIREIEQAFADAGYITPEQVKQVQMLVNQMASTAQDMAKLPVTVCKPGMMTGQGFYERFEKLVMDDISDDSDSLQEANKPVIRVMLKFAKRAAGIEDLQA